MEIKKYLTHVNYKKRFLKKNKYIIIHYTANNGDTALNNCKYFDSAYRGASANYFVDEYGVYQCVEDKDIAWHIGAHTYYNDARNENSIGVELCSRKIQNGPYYFKDKTVENAQELVKMLMAKYNIPASNVYRHWDCTRKLCPRPFIDDEGKWKKFKEGLEEEEMVRYQSLEEMPSYAVETIDKLMDLGFLKGTGQGLNLSEDMVRMLVILDRAHIFDF